MAPSTTSTSLPPPRSPLFSAIQEGNESEETEETQRFGSSTTPSASSVCTDTFIHHHHPTPLHEPGKKPGKSRRPENPSGDRSVSCSNCRPTNREKTSVVVVPVDNGVMPSPNRLFRSLIAGFSRKSPKPPPTPPPPPPESSSSAPEREEQWRITVAELSHKLVQATRKRDEAIIESSRLKYSMAELEKKLNRLEHYCHNLKSELEICGYSTATGKNHHEDQIKNPNHNDLIIKNFLISVSEARSSIRFLSKALTSQLKLMGIKVIERLSTILRPYDIKLSSSSSSNNPRNLQFYLEALLNAAFFEEFESTGFAKNSTIQILNPIERSKSNYSAFNSLKDLGWEEVLSKGTKHFSEEFSKFCDRKMSEIVTMLGWNRAWPEQLLQAFFGASKTVWLVHLLANSVQPGLMIFRVDKGDRFDPVYMEDMGGDKARKLIPTTVRIMVAPGFYVYDNVVKCKVICRYSDSNYSVISSSNDDDIRSALSPP